MRRASSGLAILLVTGALTAAALPAATPASLVSSLRAAAYPDTALPADYTSAKIGSPALAGHSRANGAVGEVEVDVDGPDPNAGIVFVVFKTAAGAHADLSGVPVDSTGLTLEAAGKLTGYAASAMFTGSLVRTDALDQTTSNGVAVAEAQQGNVLVVGFTYSVLKKGNAHGAITLLRSGMTHLQKVSAHT